MRFFTIIFTLFFTLSILPQESPIISFDELIIKAEQNPKLGFEAKQLAEKLGLPLSIYLPEGIFIEALGIENGKPVYSLVTNLLHPSENGQAVFFDHINSLYDLSKGRVDYGSKNITNPTLGYSEISKLEVMPSKFLMVVESTNRRVIALDYETGAIIDLDYIPPDAVNLSTPIQARLAPWGSITISDQLKDVVVEYDTAGTFTKILAPAGGVNNAILDNVRGHIYKSDGNLLVTCAAGANAHAIAQFDQAGNFLNNFIAPNSTIMNSPWDILFRTNDVLVSASSTNKIHRYDLNGNYLNDFASVAFPEQMFELSNGNIAVAGFSSPSGLHFFSPTGTLLNTFTAVTGLRGVWQLGNGNFLVTNSSVVHIIDQNTGASLGTILAGSGRFFGLYDEAIIPVELVSFSAEALNGQVHLNWVTASEKNNLGFEIERASSATTPVQGWLKVGFVEGKGTTTNLSSYSFVDNNIKPGNYSYRLKQIDFDGSFSYSKTVDINIELPNRFSLEQNYPNPFNPTTTIEYRLPEKSKVLLKVYDVLGKEVATLVNEEKEAGTYEVKFDASLLPSGVYYSKFYSGSFNEVKKMMLIK